MLPINSATKSVIPGISNWTVLRIVRDRDRSLLSSVAPNICRKSGVAVATPRSIVDQVTVRLECQETGAGFDPLRDRSWPVRVSTESSPYPARAGDDRVRIAGTDRDSFLQERQRESRNRRNGSIYRNEL